MKNSVSFINNLKSFIVLATFFSLWFAVYFENEIENFIAYFLILSLGILHGANDIKLIGKASKSTESKKVFNSRISLNFLRTLIAYLVVISLSVALFYFLPAIALILFILFSAYHFGEQHWASKIKGHHKVNSLTYVWYGLLILFILFYSNANEVAAVIKNITGIYVDEYSFFIFLVVFLILFCISIIKAYIAKKLKTNIFEEFFYIFLFFIVFNTASLLWAFAIYFIFWHSIPSLTDQVYYLYGNYKKENFIKYFKSSFIYWILSLIGLSLLYFLFHQQDRLFLSIFFTLIASITFPHVWVMSRFNTK
ncbi:Brp/Blh family beta-carotene 15,15'-dioxygenase [Aquimarina sp. U1-2]|uniref:Brp/Blh family beta-carotene 15,15'-dioxygenase n=1 Tax=Aquimarina sp. U1-2 TaxID=2823141 RepID=UPI001AECB9C9|nr:Brp/Blh family beta-carotene 15,15'-dioxygenase [Aquimarina sp. U1-2]MBP2832806.1 Brp/Blh family beta-carotene 15,15'-dioxygenase [Aquimarina sp. U1-2]